MDPTAPADPAAQQQQQQMDTEQTEETVDNRANEKVEDIEGKGDDTGKEQEVADEGPKMLDLAFAMDCTGSMGSYIHQAQQVR